MPSLSPADSTSAPCSSTRPRVSRSASRIATERSAKKPPTTTTAIAASEPSMKRATAAEARAVRRGAPSLHMVACRAVAEPTATNV